LEVLIFTTMGRQKGNAVFLGTYAGITGFADEGKGFWRRRTSLDGVKWRGMDSMQPCRDASVLFGAASTTAGCLWRMLPDGMKRLADGGGYNRLVAACRALLEKGDLGARDERLEASGWGVEIRDVDGLRGLDLSVESMGSHGVKSEKVKVKSGERAGSESRSYALMGLDALFSQMDEALGECAGRKSGKFAVARRVSPSRVLDEGEVLAGMGSMEGWRGVRGVKSEQLEVKSEGIEARDLGLEASGDAENRPCSRFHRDRQRRGVDGAAAGGRALSVERRVRIWVHAVRLVPLVWVEGMECFVPSDDVQPFTNGFVSDWIFGDSTSGWENSYSFEGSDWQKDGMEVGDYVVFTGIEVAEKRGRHWVRLPWCCKFGVNSVEYIGTNEGVAVRDDTPAANGGSSGREGWEEMIGRECLDGGMRIGIGMAGISGEGSRCQSLYATVRSRAGP
jgi:hypothetical protein